MSDEQVRADAERSSPAVGHIRQRPHGHSSHLQVHLPRHSFRAVMREVL